MVLLNVDRMWACPWAMFFRSLRRTFLGAPCWLLLRGGICFLSSWEVIYPGDRDYFFPAFFLPATVFFLPLRVRALVCVR